MVVQLFNDHRIVVVDLFSLFTIPDEKIDTMIESVNWLNSLSSIGCMYVERENKQVRFRKGLIIEKDTLDKMEFRKTVEKMMSARHLFFDIIKIQLVTDESPDVILAKITQTLRK